MQVYGKIEALEYDVRVGCHKARLQIRPSPRQLEGLHGLVGKELAIDMSECRYRRTLPQNAYAWVLMTEIARVVGTSKDEVYEQMLLRYAPFEKDEHGYLMLYVDDEDDVAPVDFHWKYLGRREGRKSYILMKGMSRYDRVEMGGFLERIVEEARELGIDTEAAGREVWSDGQGEA